MPVVFAAIVPHNPILLPEIGKDNTVLADESIQAISKVKELIQKQEIDTLIIFSSHAVRLQKALGINQCQKYTGEFSKFGDLVTTVSARGNIELSQQIKEYLEPRIDVQTFSEVEVDYGIAVPLKLLGTDTKPFKIIPISIASMTPREHFDIGKDVLKKADESTKKIGIIASLHLSHSDDKNQSEAGKKCDDAIVEALRNNEIKTLFKLVKDEENFKQANIYGIEGLLLLLGMIDAKKYSTEILSYQNILGTSHLTALFNW